MIIETTKKPNHLSETEATIPNEIAKKYIANSNGDLTGLRNLTIDNAPTMPKDSAIFPDITFVITKVIIGRNKMVTVWAKVLIHVCPKKIKADLPKRDMKIRQMILR